MRQNMCKSQQLTEKERERERKRRRMSNKVTDFTFEMHSNYVAHNATYNLCVIIGCYFTETIQFVYAFSSPLHRGWYGWMFWIFCLRWGIIKFGYETYSTLLNNSAMGLCCNAIGSVWLGSAWHGLAWFDYMGENFVFNIYIVCVCVCDYPYRTAQHLTYEILPTVNYQNQRKPQ